MRPIKKIHKAAHEPIADLETWRALPTDSIQYIDPFLFLNHHGPQVYPSPNHGLPFGPHPHRGFETVTFVLEGDIFHRDSGGHQGVILPGGVQWMTAGKGLIHEEISSPAFMKQGGPLEILQLWVNLPAKYKMVDPSYKDLQQADIPVFASKAEKYTVNVISGEWNGTAGVYQPLVDINLYTIHIEAGGSFTREIAAARNIFFYVIKGGVVVNGSEVPAFRLVEFANEGSSVTVSSREGAMILFGDALPFNEPVVSRGPFVMNTQREIMEAYADFQQGTFGELH